MFFLPQNLRDIINGKAEYNPDGKPSILSDRVSLRLHQLSATPRVKRLPLWQEMEYLLSQTGDSIQGQLNYYRTSKLRFEEEHAGTPTTLLLDRTVTHPLHSIAPNLLSRYKEDVPVLFIRGANDITTPDLIVDIMRQALPWTKIVTYEGAGHWLMLEKKDEVTQDVLNWLADFERK